MWLIQFLSQKGDFDKEYIFIDDGSTDDSLKILKKETRKLKNCKIISQKTKVLLMLQMLESRWQR